MPNSTHYEHYPGHNHEAEPDRIPHIYVACLAAYNAGRLHGRWLDATQELDDLYAGIQEMLAASPFPGGEEYAIHDSDNFAGYRVRENDDLATVQAIARGIVEHGPAFGALAEEVGADHLAERPELFTDSLLGTAPTMQDFATELCSDFGWEDELAKLPASMQPYVHIDYDGFARDLAIELTVIDTPDGVAVFDPHSW